MALFGWFKGNVGKVGKQQAHWREAWTRAMDAEDASQLPALREALEALNSVCDDVEVEQEMLDSLQRIAELQGGAGAGKLPEIETHHRIVGADTCHFSAPASLPADPSQPSGRVLLTNTRSLFLGGSSGTSIAWHSVRDVIRIDRDVLLVRGDGSAGAHFRFNSFSDAATAAFLARRLKGRRGTATL
jgi:hypothetical protein